MSNTFFPQLGTGFVQYPLRKQRTLRTVTNVLPGGRLILFQDTASASLNWTLKFGGISLQDANLLRAHYEVCSGPLYPFTFADPTDNLLAWSSDLSNSIWQRLKFIQIGAQILDPLGSTTAFSVTNTSQSFQEFFQTVQIPAYFSQCFSLYARSSNATSLHLFQRGKSAEKSVSVDLCAQWTRFQISGSLADSSIQTVVGFSVRPGDQVQIFGPQLEIQSLASAYTPTAATSGLYENAFFTNQQFDLTAEAPNAFAVTVNIQTWL